MILLKTSIPIFTFCSVLITTTQKNGCHGNNLQGQPAPTIAITPVVKAIQEQLDAAQAALDSNNIQVCEAQVSFQVERTTSTNADIEIWLIKPSGKRTVDRVTTISFDMKRPAAPANKELLARARILPTANLSDLVRAAGRNFDSLRTKGIAGLKANSFSIDVSFAVEYDVAAGISFKLFGSGVDAGWELDNKVQHELVLTFAPKGQCP